MLNKKVVKSSKKPNPPKKKGGDKLVICVTLRGTALDNFRFLEKKTGLASRSQLVSLAINECASNRGL